MSKQAAVRVIVPSIEIQAEVTRQIRQHARTSMSTEVCGVLIGDLRAGSETDVDIFAAIAAVNAAQAGTHVTFTQDAWEHIYKVKDAEYPDARIVGWYHSHPGFGVFLSEHDTFIQENFFSAANQVAWVFDPHTDEEGCFGWIDGEITRLKSITIADSDTPAKVSESRELTSASDLEMLDPEEQESPATGRRIRTGAPPRWLRWAASASALVAALLAGFAVSQLLFPGMYRLALPIDSVTAQPLVRDPKSGEPVYIDLQTGKSIVIERPSGKLVVVDPSTFRAAPPSIENNPFLQPQGGATGVTPAAPPATSPVVPKEKK